MLIVQLIESASLSQGTIPADLRGTYILSGSGSFDVGGEQRIHTLDGHGLVSSFPLRMAKWLRTRALREEVAAGAGLSSDCNGSCYICCHKREPNVPARRRCKKAQAWGVVSSVSLCSTASASVYRTVQPACRQAAVQGCVPGGRRVVAGTMGCVTYAAAAQARQ